MTAVTGHGPWPGGERDVLEAQQTALGELAELPTGVDAVPFLTQLTQRGPGADTLGRTAVRLTEMPVELGPHGIRVVTLASGGVPESLPEGFEGRDKIVQMIEGQTLLGRAATLEEVGNAAVFAASDWARSMTAAIVNVSCGALVD